MIVTSKAEVATTVAMPAAEPPAGTAALSSSGVTIISPESEVATRGAGGDLPAVAHTAATVAKQD